MITKKEQMKKKIERLEKRVTIIGGICLAGGVVFYLKIGSLIASIIVYVVSTLILCFSTFMEMRKMEKDLHQIDLMEAAMESKRAQDEEIEDPKE